MGKRLELALHKRDIQMANKHMKGASRGNPVSFDRSEAHWDNDREWT